MQKGKEPETLTAKKEYLGFNGKGVLARRILEGMGWDSKEVGEIEPLLEGGEPAPIT